MPRKGFRTRREQKEELARKAAQAAAAAVLEQADDEEENEDEMEESIQPGDDGRPKTYTGGKVPAAGGPAKDVKLGAEGPESVDVSRVQEQSEDDEDDENGDEDEKEVKEYRRLSGLRNPLGRHLRIEQDDEDEDDEDEDDEDEMSEGAADDQLTRTDDATRSDAQEKRRSSTWSGDIGNEVTAKSHPAVPAGNAVVEQEAGEAPRGVAAENPGNPEDQLTDADNDQAADAKRAGLRGDRGTGGKPSSGSLGAAQDKKEAPLDPATVGLDQTVAEVTNALFNGEDLTEGFKTKASTIIGAALRELMSRRNAQLVETFNGYLDDKVKEVRESFDRKHDRLVERVDDYLAYVVEQWMSENKLAVENGLRSDISASFMRGLHDLFKEHYIELPEDRVDAFTESQSRIADLEKQLKEQINSNVQLRKELSVKTVSEVFENEAKGLADTDRERLRTLAEGVEFDDADQFRSKIRILRESYFAQDRPNSKKKVDEVDEINEPGQQSLNEKMSSYVNVASKLARNPSPTGKFRQGQLNG